MTQQQGTSASKDAVRGQAPVTNGGNFGLTVSAAARITKMLANEPDGSFFRVAVLGGGCSGFQYEWGTTDKEPTVENLWLDPMAEMFVFGCTVDYVTELGGSYLVVKNPNATASCGCGESFAV